MSSKLLVPGFIRHGYAGAEYTIISLAFLFEGVESKHPFLFGVLTAVDISTILRFALITIALATLGNLSMRTSSIFVLGLFLSISLILGAVNYF